MSDLNHVVLYGHLTHNAEYRVTETGVKIASFSVANNHTLVKEGKKEEAVDFIPMVVFGEYAEHLAPYLTKGTGVIVTGSIRVKRWNDSDGSPRVRLVVYVRNVQLTSKGKNGEEAKNPDFEDEATSQMPIYEEQSVDYDIAF